MTFGQIRRTAEEMGVNVQHAVWCRLRYLRQRMIEAADDLEFWSSLDCPTAPVYFDRTMDEFITMAKEARTLTMSAKNPQREQECKDRITDEQIEVARQYPVTQLIDFQRGKSRAWCHEDRNPSLYPATRINKAVCPVCGKYFNSIDIVMELEGLNFVDAVLRLAA